jgi:hypothetical protein
MEPRSAWQSHDWKVKTMEALVSGGGSRLEFKCRRCERRFNQTTANHRIWAVDLQGIALLDDITSRWLGEQCAGQPGTTDDDDRLKVKYQRAQTSS